MKDILPILTGFGLLGFVTASVLPRGHSKIFGRKHVQQRGYGGGGHGHGHGHGYGGHHSGHHGYSGYSPYDYYKGFGPYGFPFPLDPELYPGLDFDAAVLNPSLFAEYLANGGAYNMANGAAFNQANGGTFNQGLAVPAEQAIEPVDQSNGAPVNQGNGSPLVTPAPAVEATPAPVTPVPNAEISMPPVIAEPSGAPVVEPSEAPVVEPSGVSAVEPSGAPAVEPSGAPVIEPSGAPVVEPSGAPVVEPSTPVVEPSAPVVEPSAPVVEPSAPVVEPSGAPVVEPSAPVVAPSAPVAEPSAPVAEPSAPVVEPSAPVVEPSAPVVEPSAPVVEPSAPVAEPSAPVVEPSAPVVEPSAPIVAPSAPPSSAPASPLATFVCNAVGYLVQSNSLYSLNATSGLTSLLSSTIGAGGDVTSIGYNVLDNTIWGVVSILGANSLVQIGSDGGQKPLAVSLGAGYWNAGDIDNTGKFYITQGGGVWAVIDLAPGSATFGTIIESGDATASIIAINGMGIFDWVYLPARPGYLYAVTIGPSLVRFNLATHIWEKIMDYPSLAGTNQFGSFWGSDTDEFYGQETTTGNIYTFNAGGGAATLLSTSLSVPSGDGARCISAVAASPIESGGIPGRFI
ncbi:hypothetical protein BU24DRAFT_476888 [Aaosphaeria arxii CBS 175.79]|uniref:DUF6923 domain-containing protein n=1 Tax=Aaosphaeria arxii CBS 175.79 TaxID=1450172 RepID=A0A6A5Y2S3_9PLEO|nr:uncharacterized protein BU24DRAFT_476888 [Aaosphaeria arxii CBS 175.79]KAF2019842.1 hypothetical protein BU24DRAFT_476888 [Aaosphaeria arxii CBS 175.79]